MSSRSKDLMSVLAAIGLCTGTAMGNVLHVDDDAPPAGDGQSWATAYRFLQDALAEAQGGDVTEIRVAEGLYRPDRDELDPAGTGERMATFQLVNGVLLAGGYAGIGAPDPDERDVSGYVTTLSGDLLGDDGPEFANNGDNSWHVVTVIGNDGTAKIDGVTITAGNASGPEEEDQWGAGMVINDGSDAAISGSTFIGNVAALAGGAIRCGDSTVAISNSSFVANHANGAGRGGGAISSVDSELAITGGLFLENRTSGEGGVTATVRGTTTVRNATLIENHADWKGGGLCTMETGATHVANSIIYGNTADSGSAQIFNRHTAVTRVSWSNTEGGLDDEFGVFDDGGNIDADPAFLDPTAGDYRLGAGSPSIDAGNNDDAEGITEDLDGHPRFVDDPDTKDTGEGDPPIVDMGAYEFQVCSGDLDGSGDVGFEDLLRVLAAWGNKGGPEDLDDSGTVDFNDLLIVLGSWGPCA